jgi:hypothetical protein
VSAPSIGAASTERARLGAWSGAGLGLGVLWLSVLVLLPLAAVVAKGIGPGFWDAITSPAALAAIRLTVASALIVAAVNAVLGTLVAWVLVRDSFWGKRVVEAVIDIPFALPTIVAGLVLLALYGQHSAIGIDWFATRRGVLVALLFVTLPFVVRAVEPVLLARCGAVHRVPAHRAAGDRACDRVRGGAGVRAGDGRVRIRPAHFGRTAEGVGRFAVRFRADRGRPLRAGGSGFHSIAVDQRRRARGAG